MIPSGSGIDFGIISFFTVIITSAYLFYLATSTTTKANADSTTPTATDEVANNQQPRTTKIESKATARWIVASQSLVSLNYAGGVIIALAVISPIKIGFAIYCAVFTILWVASACLGWWLLNQYRSSQQEAGTLTVGECSSLAGVM